MSASWKSAGFSYNRYVAIASRTLRNALKEEKRVVAEKRGHLETRFAKWEKGQQEEYAPLSFNTLKN